MKPGYRSKVLIRGNWVLRLGRSNDGQWSHKGKPVKRIGVQHYTSSLGEWWFISFYSYGVWIVHLMERGHDKGNQGCTGTVFRPD